MSHRIDVVMGLITSAITVIGVAFAVFGPATYSYGTNSMSAASTSLWEQGLESGVVIYLAAMLVLGLAVTVGAYLRTLGFVAEGATVLWVTTVGLLVGALITLPGNDTAIVPSALHTGSPDSVAIGIYLLPAALMAFATAIVSTAVHHTPGRPVSFSPR